MFLLDPELLLKGSLGMVVSTKVTWSPKLFALLLLGAVNIQTNGH